MTRTTVPLPTKRMLKEKEAMEYAGFETVGDFRANCPVVPVNYGDYVRFDVLHLDAWLTTLSQSITYDELDIVGAAGNEVRSRAGH